MGRKVSADEVQKNDGDWKLNQAYEAEKHFEVSLSEIVKFPSYKEICGGEYQCTQKDLYSFLYTLGLNTKKKVEEQYCTHRNKFNEAVTCARWVGYKRVDKEWLEKGVSK